MDCCDTYMNGNPKHGVQELGQIIEAYLLNLAFQAKKKGKFPSRLTKGVHIPLSSLLDNLIQHRVIDRGLLGNCRGFVKPRNNTSHRAKTIREAQQIEKKHKENFLKAITILEEMPKEFKAEGYRFVK